MDSRREYTLASALRQALRAIYDLKISAGWPRDEALADEMTSLTTEFGLDEMED